jgi:metal-responsive CopG/Arc/MetJ family transcriptional regulator
MTRRISINISEDVFKKVEEKRGTRSHFRSGYIDDILREKFGIPKRDEK